MRVAIFRELPYDFPGGVSNLLNIMLDYLERNGHEVRVFIADDGENERPPGPFVPFPTVTTRSWARSRFSLPLPLAWRVRRELKAFKPDVVHLLHPIVLGSLGCHYARLSGIPRVVSFHTLYHDYAAYHGLDFLGKVALWWCRRVFNDCHLTLAPSPSLSDFLSDKGFKRVLVWARGVDVERFNPNKRSEEWRQSVLGQAGGQTPLILYVGRLAKEKNLDILVTLAKSMEGVHWVLVGDGPQRGALAEALRGVPHTFTGHLEGNQLCEVYASADIFFMPSTTEGCPNTVMEAFSSGLPVVGAEEFGTGDLLRESGAGVTFRADDEPAETRRSLETLISDPSLAGSYRARGRAFAESRSWDIMMAQLIKHYANAVELNSLSAAGEP